MAIPNNKFRFINRSNEDNSISLAEDPAGTKKCAEISIKFVPGQEVYLLQNSTIIKTTVDHIKINMIIDLKKYESNIIYVTKDGLDAKENELFAKIEDLPIVDKTKNADLEFDVGELETEAKEESQYLTPKKPRQIKRASSHTDNDDLPF